MGRDNCYCGCGDVQVRPPTALDRANTALTSENARLRARVGELEARVETLLGHIDGLQHESRVKVETLDAQLRRIRQLEETLLAEMQDANQKQARVRTLESALGKAREALERMVKQYGRDDDYSRESLAIARAVLTTPEPKE